jgi:hypothetical protein
MPQLPGVEGFMRALKTCALRKTIEHAIVSDARILGDLAVRTFATKAAKESTVMVAAASRERWSAVSQRRSCARRLAVLLGIAILIKALVLLAIGWRQFDLGNHPGQLQTFTFQTLVFFALFSIESIRERRAFWASRPSIILAGGPARRRFPGRPDRRIRPGRAEYDVDRRLRRRQLPRSQRLCKVLGGTEWKAHSQRTNERPELGRVLLRRGRQQP